MKVIVCGVCKRPLVPRDEWCDECGEFVHRDSCSSPKDLAHPNYARVCRKCAFKLVALRAIRS